MVDQLSRTLAAQRPARSLMPITGGNYTSWGKLLFDSVIAFLVTAGILFWLIPLIGIAIRLESPGPILFVQMRTGRNGHPFRCLKFRTMRYKRNAEFLQATPNDPRITRLGHLLRKTNLDEMPQFLNVLAGHMSIIGPRPHPIQLDAQYWQSLPGYVNRYCVRPGITGLAQARGARGETAEWYKMHQRLRYDQWYIRRQSLGLDLMICWWTIAALFRKNNNAC
ncbi:sugar transferase [Larkinella soli]|uniref:sugar transferase n=1 Tax=Larkinella soli TaxID=1770527 RepID=UPI000FFC8B17|nr:sugar transferase [Larkinella soli]